MFERKIDEIVMELPNVFSVTDCVLGAGYNDDDSNQNTVLRKCYKYSGKRTLN